MGIYKQGAMVVAHERSMKILGIADNHDSGAALLIDGELVGAINQERIDRKKNSSAFPYSSIDAVCSSAGISPREVDTVVVGTSYTPSAFLRLAHNLHQKYKKEGQFSYLLHGYMLYQSLLRRTGLDTLEKNASSWILKKKLSVICPQNPQIHLIDHHEAHAQGAYRTQKKDRCLVFTLDAMGDGCSASVWQGENQQLRPLWDQSGLAAINLFYSRITEILGFRPLRHEGKITGLAARGTIEPNLVEEMRRMISFSKGSFQRMPVWTPAQKTDDFWQKIQKMDRNVVAACTQHILEEVTCAYILYWVEKTGCPDIALAGGVFANVRLNQKLALLPQLRSLWVVPHMGDGGLPVGGLLAFTQSPPKQIQHVFWGAQHTNIDILRAIQRNRVQTIKENIIEQAADILCSGGIIARSAGAMEWGPRALGNRSVLACAHDVSINDRLNQKLRRSEFMPFAPMLREEDASKYFYDITKYGECPYYMTICVHATPRLHKEAPAVVHIDGTARPQLLRKTQHPELHALLTAIESKTGCGVLINTSFNLHEEPIVCTPDESIRAAISAELDALWLEDTLLLF